MLFPIHQIIFYVFSVLLIAASVMVITAKNPVKAVLFLVVAFFASAVLWMLLQAEFLALVLLFVYVGAVMTLFLFVVMMINIDRAALKASFVRYYPFGLLTLVILLGIAFYVFTSEHWQLMHTLPTLHPEKYDNVQLMGKLLMTQYLLPFELSAVLLLIGMVSAIALAFHGRKTGTKSQVIAQQISANKEENLKIVDLRKSR